MCYFVSCFYAFQIEFIWFWMVLKLKIDRKEKKNCVTIYVHCDTILLPILRVSNQQTSCHDLFNSEYDLRSAKSEIWILLKDRVLILQIVKWFAHFKIKIYNIQVSLSANGSKFWRRKHIFGAEELETMWETIKTHSQTSN